ncbi:MAG: ATP-binding cassette, subfamily bacterial [Gaiellaceae bacterium]|nr:ATP-binding cassette, subfamily bacterial [Gaiellaceae bacterium]
MRADRVEGSTPDGSPADDNGSEPLTAFDLARPVDRRGQMRRTPRLVVEALKIAWRASPRHLSATVALQLTSGVGVAVQLLIARRIMQGLVTVTQGGPVSSLYTPFGLLVGTTAVLGVIGAFSAHHQALLAEMVARHAWDRIIGVAKAIDYRLFETSDFYDQLQRARASGEFRTIELVGGITALLTALISTIGIAAVLFVLHPLLVALVVLSAIPALLAALRNSRESYAFAYTMTPEGRERAYIVDLLTERWPAKEVRLFNLGSFLHGRYQALTNERLGQLRIFLRRRLVVTLLGTLASAAGTAVAFGALLVLLGDGRINVATALTAGLAMQQLGGRLTAITSSFGRLIESGMFIDDYYTFLALAEEGPRQEERDQSETAGKSTREGAPAFRGLAVEELSFSYPTDTTPVLEDVSLEIAPGEVVALVGENGSGKTTLVKLICQLYQPDAGRILWDGLDAKTMSPESVQSAITVLFQDFIQYHLSASDNIVFGRVDRQGTRADAVAAASQAGADEFVTRLPQGYDTRLGLQFFGGHELSVGQWQRLALARAFYRGGDFLILDEPTASLDARAERDLFAQIRTLSAGRSVLLISHRFSSVMTADRIYVLQDGRVAEHGSHVELMARDGHYAELFRLQAAAYLGNKPIEVPTA